MYSSIKDPNTGAIINVKSKNGIRLINKYLNYSNLIHIGGSDQASLSVPSFIRESRIPLSERPFQIGKSKPYRKSQNDRLELYDFIVNESEVKKPEIAEILIEELGIESISDLISLPEENFEKDNILHKFIPENLSTYDDSIAKIKNTISNLSPQDLHSEIENQDSISLTSEKSQDTHRSGTDPIDSTSESNHHDWYEGDNEKENILREGKIGDTVEYHTDNQLGYAVFKIVSGDELDGKTLKQIGDIYGSFSDPNHPEYIGLDDDSDQDDISLNEDESEVAYSISPERARSLFGSRIESDDDDDSETPGTPEFIAHQGQWLDVRGSRAEPNDSDIEEDTEDESKEGEDRPVITLADGTTVYYVEDTGLCYSTDGGIQPLGFYNSDTNSLEELKTDTSATNTDNQEDSDSSDNSDDS